MKEFARPSREFSTVNTGTEWDKLGKEDFSEEKAKQARAAEIIANKFIRSTEFDSCFYDEDSDTMMATDRPAALMESMAREYGYNTCLDANKRILSSARFTSYEKNDALAEDLHATLDRIAREGVLEKDLDKQKRAESLSVMLDKVEDSVSGDEDGRPQALESVARHLISDRNRQFLVGIRSNKISPADRRKYNLDIALLESLRGMLLHREGEFRERSGDEFTMEKELINTGKTSEQKMKEEQARARHEREEREKRLRRAEAENAEKKRQELEELRRLAIKRSRQAQEKQRRRQEEQEEFRKSLQEDIEDEMGMEM